jgi:hypothetical protein
VHATTGEAPRERYARDEQACMRADLTPAGLEELTAEPGLTRQVDKTGLLAWKANKYSAPLAYQRARVGVVEHDGQLLIRDLASGELIARHALASGKGTIVKNTHHYRDPAQALAELEEQISQRLGEAPGARLCARIKATEPKHYRDQLRGVLRLLDARAPLNPDLIATLCEKPALSFTRLRDYLDAYAAHPERWSPAEPRPSPTGPTPSPLARYAAIATETATEVRHDIH